ncbi:MAG TPA: hypothetical protein VK586_17660, partial [Streptosporangiaceae bacterium]|nr:hypothetical protein [Streptosporangiaceae bacterium]
MTAARVPGRIARLPKDHIGRPVPWFVAEVNGVPDFRVIKTGAIEGALYMRLCWVCGVPFQRQEDRAFTVGPMSMVNRVSAEPPAHRDCAVYSATACFAGETRFWTRNGLATLAETVGTTQEVLTKSRHGRVGGGGGGVWREAEIRAFGEQRL